VGDAAALARELTALLRDAPLRAQIGAAGRRRAAAFDIRRSVRRAEEVYAELLA
jgi:glycosyltransferase involved in cell wall biosynthesis